MVTHFLRVSILECKLGSLSRPLFFLLSLHLHSSRLGFVLGVRGAVRAHGRARLRTGIHPGSQNVLSHRSSRFCLLAVAHCCLSWSCGPRRPWGHSRFPNKPFLVGKLLRKGSHFNTLGSVQYDVCFIGFYDSESFRFIVH